MTAAETLSASLENYLKAILLIETEKHAARAKDIAARLKVGSSSVTGALRSLTDRGLVNYAPYDLITLTPKGKRIARDVVRRHTVLSRFLVEVLSVDTAEADEAACQMEHVISKSVLERLVHFVEFVESCPRAGAKWIKGLGYFCEQGADPESCRKCIEACSSEFAEKLKRGGGNEPMSVELPELQPGEKGKISSIRVAGETKKRIIEMGVTSGTIIEVERVAPLGDPIEIKVKGYSLSLRRDEAKGITVVPLES